MRLAGAVLCGFLAACDVASASDVRSLEVVSNRADLVSGGDALVAATLAPNAEDVRVDLDGTDVTSAFAMRATGRFEGVVTGLRVGVNTLTVRAGSGGKRITITNHPIGGPVFAGPQVTPYACNPNASTPPLGPALDAQCNAPTRVELLYRNAAGQFVAYDPANPPAPTIQTTTTDSGRTVPFIVERVTGTVDRGIFQFAALVDPAKPVTPWSTEQPWSRKLLLRLRRRVRHRAPAARTAERAAAGGPARRRLRRRHVEPQRLRQQLQRRGLGRGGDDDQGTRHRALRRAALHDRQRRLGGHDAAAPAGRELPGLLDGLTTSQAFEDHFTQVQGSLDCRVLMHYFWPTSPLTLPGHATAPPNPLFPTAARTSARVGQQPGEPGQPVRAEGAAVRRRPHRARADRQRGLRAAAGAGLAPDEQPDRRALRHRRLHARGLRRHGHARRAERQGAPRGRQRRRPVRAAARSSAARSRRSSSPTSTPRSAGSTSTATSSRSGPRPIRTRCGSPTRPAGSTAAPDAADIPEIDNRTGGQGDDTGFHPPFHSFTYRARLDKANGHHDNQVIWLSRPGGTVPNQFDLMRKWLDTGAKPRASCATRASWPATCRPT